MNYDEALAYIHSARKLGDKPGLLRIEGLLEALGNPHKRLKFIHVAGTNGKGSICAMTESVLRAAGYKTGLYISPFLEDFCERMQVNRRNIGHERLARLVTEVAGVSERHVAAGGLPNTEFELVTAMALLYFAEEECDVVVLEVGLGGRLDATNVIDAPEVAVIASISLDHTEILGETIALIAREKCGIIKPGCAVVTCPAQNPEALAVISDVCREKNVPLSLPDEGKLVFISAGRGGSRFIYGGLKLKVPLSGAHQIQNAMAVAEIVPALRSRGWSIPDAAVIDGIAATRWSGRLEIVRKSPLCLIDGAHNVDAMSVLCAALDSLYEGRRIITVMAMCRDKNYGVCVPMIAKRSAVFIATQATDIPRALKYTEVARAAAGLCPQIESLPDVSSAAARALELAGPDDVVLVCGSLYMAGEAKNLLTDKNA